MDVEGWRWISAPAKVNLILSVHGKREDGFHALSSIVAPVEYGDRLAVRPTDFSENRLICEHSDVPTDESNLVLGAARIFLASIESEDRFEFFLEKKVPVGAGLGGGSSDGTSALVALNELYGSPLNVDALQRLAAELGSDCALFVEPKPALMKGRGEHITALDASVRGLISGRRILLFRPPFAVPTGWAYEQLAATAGAYEPKELADARLTKFYDSGDLGGLLFNSFESVVGAKYQAIPAILKVVRDFGHEAIMSGSGSCCFAILADHANADQLAKECQKALGTGIFCVETLLL